MLTNTKVGFRKTKNCYKFNYSTKASVESTPPLKTTYQKLFAEQVATYPHKNFFSSPSENIRWTYKEAQAQQDAYASGLIESCGPSIATAVPLRSESLMTQCASARANRPWTPLEYGTTSESIEAQLRVANPGAFVYPAKVGKKIQLDNIYKVFPYFQESIPGHIINDKRFPNLRQVLHLSKTDLKGLVHFTDILVYGNPAEIQKVESSIDINAPIVNLLSGNSKVTLSQNNILNTGYFVGNLAGITEEDIVLTTLQVHEASGLSLGLALSLSHKCQLVYGADVFDASLISASLKEEFCTTLVCLPNEIEELLNLNNFGFEKVSKVIISTSPTRKLSKSAVDKLSALGKKVVVTFGTNESSGVLAVNVNPTNYDSNTIGKALPHTQITVSSGNIALKGFNVAVSVPKGELLTGLKGKINGEGVVTLE